MLNPVINLISEVIFLINLGLIVWVVLGLLINLDIVNRYNPLVSRVHTTLDRVFEPLLRPIRTRLSKWLPHLGIDLSAIVLLLLLNFINNTLYSWFYTI